VVIEGLGNYSLNKQEGIEMKTVVIFDNFDNGSATCVVMDGDFTHLHNQFLNGVESESLCDEIDTLTKDACKKYGVDEWYTSNLPTFPSEEFYEAVKAGAKVIITGCLP